MADDSFVGVGSQLDENTVLLTSEEMAQEWLNKLMSSYDPDSHANTAYLEYTNSPGSVTQSDLQNYAATAQTNLSIAQTVIGILRKYINYDNLIGLVTQSIVNNVNTEYHLSFSNFNGQRNKAKTLEKAKAVLNDFNVQIDIEQLIASAVELAYCEGTYICMIQQRGENWTLSYLPLGVAEISGYNDNGRPVVLINMTELKSALQKTQVKAKNGKYLFYKNTEEEIKACYPKEVYDAYKNHENYAKLDVAYTGVVRINSHGRKYGLSPLFRAISPMLTLESFQNADNASAKAVAKKVVHQVLRKECMGPNGATRGFDVAIYAHKELVSAWKNSTVVYTSIPAVERIEYIEPKVTDVSERKISEYRNMVLTSLGINFLGENNSNLTAASAKLSLAQLMRQINSISRSVERMIENFYATVLSANGIGLEYRPTVHIIDAEMLEMNMRIDLAKLLYTTFAVSRETAMSTVGISLEDERVKRESENAANLNDVFQPYSYNAVVNDGGDGRPPSSDDKDKQEYDKNRTKEKKTEGDVV